ncbi:Rid family hydrolase [Peribacillus frigoritolerans]|uniref:Rid family hydrolase n=1 Tax=Peribacillus frigoritolerans TaxID=450367 RepID=UPI0024C11F7D|nr:Rid family hydrolase [Peribacillus frigoritolerans]WHX69211.1 Rid family hydrolase [Peribacillus frigoritolerans]
MKTPLKSIIAASVLVISLIAGFPFVSAAGEKDEMKSDKVTFFGSPTSAISSSVAIPQSYNRLLFSGTVAPLLNKDGKTTYERYGNTKKQAIGILEKLKADLSTKGLSLADVTYLRVYVAPDPNKGDAPDYQGWFDAYALFFNTKENPVKTARSTVGVQSLVSPDYLIEIEAEVAYKNNSKANK